MGQIAARNVPVPIEVGLARLDDLLELQQALLGNKDEIIAHHRVDVELTRIDNVHVADVLRSADEIVVSLKRREEQQPVDAEWLDDLVQKSRLRELEGLAVDNDQFVFVQLRAQHDLESLEADFGWQLFGQVAELRAVGSTTLRPVRRSLVTDSCFTSALLRSWLYATASDVTLCLGHVRLL